MLTRVENVRDQLRGIDELATIPSAMARIMRVVENETSNALDLATEIALDQALTTRILRVVNSSYYGFQHRILTIPEAVVLLGFSEVEKMALAISVVNLFGQDRASVKSLQLIWRHSLACSVAAGVFELRFRVEKPEIRGAHVAGLLHDIGKAAIAQHFPRVTAAIEMLVREEGMTTCEAEQELLGGVTHCEIGAQLAEYWDLPPALIESIALHHDPESATVNPTVVYVTHLANEICNSLGLCAGTIPAQPKIHAAARDALGLDYDLVAAVRSQLDHSRSLIGAVASGAMCL